MYTFQDLIDHFKDQPEIQNQILANTDPTLVEWVDRISLGGVLTSCFMFSGTPEGEEYWYKVLVELRHNAPQPL